jgi:uncharacterized membrane protein
MSRRTQFFAVTVPASFRQSDEARDIIRRYRYQVTVHCALGLCGIVFVAMRHAPNWLVLPLLWPAAGSMFAVALAHRTALRYAAPSSGVRVASLEPRPRSLPGGPLVWAGPFAILAASAVYVGLRWSEIPARYPTHWGFDGRPNGWSVRSLPGVYTPLLIGTLVCVLLLFLVWQIPRNSRGSAATRALIPRVLLSVAYFMAALFGWLTASLPLGGGAPTALVLGITLAAPIILISAVIFFGMRARDEPEPDADSPSVPESVLGLSAPAGDGTVDRNWKAGLFYFNPDDPALFVEKRIGIGYDLNFGNPRAWIFMGVFLLIPVIVLLMRKL